MAWGCEGGCQYARRLCWTGGEKLHLRLKKALYRLRSASLHWPRHLSGLLGRLFNMVACPTEPCLFTGTYKGKNIYIISYVDDVLLAGASTEELCERG